MAGSWEIDVRLESRRRGITAQKIRLLARKILKSLGWKKAALSILLVNDRAIRKINKQHLRHDWPTDVISFGQFEGRPLKSNPKPLLGDVVISIETASREARVYGHSMIYETAFYLAHGILHLMGHDDNTPAKRLRMHRLQEKILKRCGLKHEITGKR